MPNDGSPSNQDVTTHSRNSLSVGQVPRHKTLGLLESLDQIQASLDTLNSINRSYSLRASKNNKPIKRPSYK